MSITVTDNVTNNFEGNKKPFQYLNLHLRQRFTPFNLPLVDRLSAALNETLPDQQGMIHSALKGRGQGKYKTQLTQPLNYISSLKVTLRGGGV